MNETKIKYGCEVCKHLAVCELNPFGICKDYEEKEEEDKHDTEMLREMLAP
jgi:hypothetical protein